MFGDMGDTNAMWCANILGFMRRDNEDPFRTALTRKMKTTSVQLGTLSEEWTVSFVLNLCSYRALLIGSYCNILVYQV